MWWIMLGALAAQASGPEWQAPEIHVPEGFVVEVAAAPPLVEHPMMAGFDERGRLFIAESSGENLKAADLVSKLPSFIRMIEDTDGDGRFDKSTIFADRMTLPQGALWHDGALYVASPPSIWRLVDTDDDGVCDVREELVNLFGFSGNAADVHGCFLGPTGRIFWCDGRHGHELRDGRGRPTSKGLAARIFSCRPDGSDVRVHCGGGMDNPVEVCFTEEGEMIGTVAILNNKPARMDALVHWIHGGVYPHHQSLNELKRTGDLLPPMSQFGQVAPAGIMRYRGVQFGPDYQHNLFHAQFNTHKVVRTTIERLGSSFRSRDEDFLVSPSPDFHPTDVLADADGSLLVIDTGGWFRIGCPLSKVAKPDIGGAIYRVRRNRVRQKRAREETRDHTPEDPRGVRIDWNADLAQHAALWLTDERPTVRDRAVEILAREGTVGPRLLESFRSKEPGPIRDLVWACARIGSPQALAAIRGAMERYPDSIRLASIHALGAAGDTQARECLERFVVEESLAIRREAAMALGRIGDPAAVPSLFESLRKGGDRILEHALIYALIEIDDRSATAPGLSDPSPLVRKGALIALDQMESGQLTRELVAPLLDTSDLELQRAAMEILTRRGWASDLVELVAAWLSDGSPAASRLPLLRGALLALKDDEKAKTLIGQSLEREGSPLPLRLILLEVIGRSGSANLPPLWAQAMRRSLAAPEGAVVLAAVQAVAMTGTIAFDDRLASLALDGAVPARVRTAALKTVASRLERLPDSGFDLLVGLLDDEGTPVMDRLEAAEVLGRATLDSAQLQKLAGRLVSAGPTELSALLGAFERPRDQETSRVLEEALAAAPSLSTLPPARVRKLFSESTSDRVQKILAQIEAQAAKEGERLAELEPLLDQGNAQRGKELFASRRAGCQACHRIAGEGNLVGPDLSRIGEVRAPRDLLEAIVLPSATFARGFEPYSVALTSGDVVAGIIGRETGDTITMVTAQRAEVPLHRDQIEALSPSKVSIMPQGLDRTLSAQELADLVAYLRSLR